MGIQIKRIGHVGILVSDFDKSFKFYTDVMGCKVTNQPASTSSGTRQPDCDVRLVSRSSR